MKKRILVFLSLWCYALAVAQTNCHCPKNNYTDTEADTVFHFSKGHSIALCGYRYPDTDPPQFTEFALSVCGQDTTLGFWGALYQYRVNLKQDTLFINRIEYLPVGENFKRKEVRWSTEKLSFKGNRVERYTTVNKMINLYDSRQIQLVLQDYTQAFKQPEKKYDKLMGELFVATLSGSKEARQDLFSMKNLTIGAAGGEYQDRLIRMLYFWEAQHNTILPDSVVSAIQKLRHFVLEYQVDSLANYIEYPLRRTYPIPSIFNKKEFVNRYESLFDNRLQKLILVAPLNRWTPVGWRGIMLYNGLVWLDYNGKIMAVNYESRAEQARQKKLLAKDRATLYASLQTYKQPVLKINTKKYHIRIDRLKNGKFRYVAWKRGMSESQKPDLVLTNGTVKYDGSGGNHRYIFDSGAYQYVVRRVVIGTVHSPEAWLIVKKNTKKILQETADVLGR